MADARGRAVEYTNIVDKCNEKYKKGRHDIIHIYDAWLNSMALHNSHIYNALQQDSIA